ncbi:MAG: Gfo/Idh/MocA family oxidoreductase [Phototrophicaceae bacterium]
MLKVLLAGLGVRGKYWADVINRSDRSEIVAYADPNPQALTNACQEFGEHPTYESAEDAIADRDDIDALVLANPPIGRESQVRAAVASGIPMMIEKPLALSLDEASHLVKIAEDANISMMVGLNFRYLGVTIATQQLLANQTVGNPEFGRFTYERWRDGSRPDLNKYPLTMSHPMLWEQSIHHFDLMRYVYQSEPLRVQCHTWNPSWSMYDDDTNVSAIFEFKNGVTVNYQGTWQSNWQTPNFEWRTDCTDGVITQRDQFGDLSFAKRDEPDLTSVALPPHERWVSDTTGLWDAFLTHVLDGKPLECSGRDHLHSLAMLEACIQSSVHHQVIHVDDLLRTI